MAAGETERLARVIARSGRASRREAERLVEEGRVTVNGETVHHPAHAVHPSKDDIRLDGKRLPKAPPRTTVLLYKPRGTVTDILVSEPPFGAEESVPSAPAKNTCVLKVLGGEPKPWPKMVTMLPHGPLVGVTREMTGCGTMVLVGVAVGPGVSVGRGVLVGVGVAPSGA